MAWTGVSNILPQYSSGTIPALDKYLKFYAAGTTTPILAATDATGGTLVDKFRIDADGYPVGATNDPVIPHIDQVYKIAMFLTDTDADANNLNNAVWAIDNMEPVKTIGSDEANEDSSLTDGQLQVTTTNGTLTSDLYINGILVDNGRLAINDDYTFDSGIPAYNLVESYPDGTTITIVP